MDKRKEANLHVKNSIVGALIDLMKEKNFEDISVSEITIRAGVSRVSYYRNFDSKEDILIGSLKDLMSRFTEEINAIPSHTPTRRVMTVFFRVARENASIFNLLHQAGMDPDSGEPGPIYSFLLPFSVSGPPPDLSGLPVFRRPFPASDSMVFRRYD